MSTNLQKTPATQTRRPYYRVQDGDTAFTVEVFMPGVDKGNHQVTLHDQELLIEGRRSALNIPDARWLHREIPGGDYKLRLQLNVDVNAEGITAKSEDGVLLVTLPVAEAALPRQIKIQ